MQLQWRLVVRWYANTRDRVSASLQCSLKQHSRYVFSLCVTAMDTRPLRRDRFCVEICCGERRCQREQSEPTLSSRWTLRKANAAKQLSKHHGG